MKRVAPFNVGFYLANVKSYSANTSDSEGTAAFKTFMQKSLGNKQELLKTITSLKDEVNKLKRTIADKDKQMQDTSSLVEKLKEMN